MDTILAENAIGDKQARSRKTTFRLWKWLFHLMIRRSSTSKFWEERLVVKKAGLGSMLQNFFLCLGWYLPRNCHRSHTKARTLAWSTWAIRHIRIDSYLCSLVRGDQTTLLALTCITFFFVTDSEACQVSVCYLHCSHEIRKSTSKAWVS